MIWLDNSRTIAIYAVIVLHVAVECVKGFDVGSDYWWIGNIYTSPTRWCVPVFVMISGALLLDPRKQEDLRTFYKKRIFKILIPLLFWSFFFLNWSYLLGVFGGNPPSIGSLLEKVLYGRPYFHMWYLYMILGLYLFTPFLRKIVAHSTTDELRFLVGALFVLAAINCAYVNHHGTGSRLFFNWTLSYVPYFLMGYLIRESTTAPPRSILWVVFASSCVLTCLGMFFVASRSGFEQGRYFYSDLSVTVVPMSISVMYLLKRLRWPVFGGDLTRKLSILTLGVYLAHPVAIEIINFAGMGTKSFNPLFSIPLVSTSVLVVSFAGAWVVAKIPYVRRTI